MSKEILLNFMLSNQELMHDTKDYEEDLGIKNVCVSNVITLVVKDGSVVYASGNMHKEFKCLGVFLNTYAPKLSYIQYREILELVKYKVYSVNGGSYISSEIDFKAIMFIDLERLANYLIENNVEIKYELN